MEKADSGGGERDAGRRGDEFHPGSHCWSEKYSCVAVAAILVRLINLLLGRKWDG